MGGKSLNRREKNSGEEKFLTIFRPNFFLARLDFFLPQLTAPGSPRMVSLSVNVKPWSNGPASSPAQVGAS